MQRQRKYIRQLQLAADEGDPTAIASYMFLTHVGALNFETKRKKERACQS